MRWIRETGSRGSPLSALQRLTLYPCKRAKIFKQTQTRLNLFRHTSWEFRQKREKKMKEIRLTHTQKEISLISRCFPSALEIWKTALTDLSSCFIYIDIYIYDDMMCLCVCAISQPHLNSLQRVNERGGWKNCCTVKGGEGRGQMDEKTQEIQSQQERMCGTREPSQRWKGG